MCEAPSHDAPECDEYRRAYASLNRTIDCSSRNAEGGGDTFFLQHIIAASTALIFAILFLPLLIGKFSNFQILSKKPAPQSGMRQHYGCAFSPNAVLISRAVSLTAHPD